MSRNIEAARPVRARSASTPSGSLEQRLRGLSVLSFGRGEPTTAGEAALSASEPLSAFRGLSASRVGVASGLRLSAAAAPALRSGRALPFFLREGAAQQANMVYCGPRSSQWSECPQQSLYFSCRHRQSS
jgi:hypothetical protein